MVNSVGVFLDVDNLFPSWKSGTELHPYRGYYLRASDYLEMCTEIEERLAIAGSVVVRHAFGSWDNPARALAAAVLEGEFGYDLHHAPPLSRVAVKKGEQPLKNGSDIQLAVRAVLATATTRRPLLDTVVIGAADSDYQPLALELRRMGVHSEMLSFPLGREQQKLLARAFGTHRALTPVLRWQELESAQKAIERHESPVLPRVDGAAPSPRPTQRPIEDVPRATTTTVGATLWNAAAGGTTTSLLGERAASRLAPLSESDIEVLIWKLGSDGLLLIDRRDCRLPDGADREAWLRAVAVHLVDSVTGAHLRQLTGVLGSSALLDQVRLRTLTLFVGDPDITEELVDASIARHAAPGSGRDAPGGR